MGRGFHEHVPAIVKLDGQFLCAYVGGSPNSSPNGATVEEINNLTTEDRKGGMAENIKDEAFGFSPDAMESGD